MGSDKNGVKEHIESYADEFLVEGFEDVIQEALQSGYFLKDKIFLPEIIL